MELDRRFRFGILHSLRGSAVRLQRGHLDQFEDRSQSRKRSQRLATMDDHRAQSAITQFSRNTRAIVLLDLASIKLPIISECPSAAQRLCKILPSANAAQDEDLTPRDLIQYR